MRTLTRLALSNNRKNKTRSVLIMTAVFLTTVLLAAIASFGYGEIQFEKRNAVMNYGSYYGLYANVTEDQIHAMNLRSEFGRIGKSAKVGEVDNKTNITLYWMDDDVLEMSNLNQHLEDGRFPEQESEIAGQEDFVEQKNEIAGQAGFFEKLGYPNAKVGDEITLSYRRNNHETFGEETFVISGIIKTFTEEQENQGYAGYVSKSFYESRYAEEERLFNAYFRLSDTVKVHSDTVEMTAKALAEECGINPDKTLMNKYYTILALDMGTETIMGCLVVVLMVIVFSVLVIYNIFQVGVVQKIQEYGKLKALGATRKQMKKLVFREGMLLALPVIPFGLIAGTVITKVYLSYWIAESVQLSGREVDRYIPISIPLLLLCAAIALFTVWIALKKPMKVVAKVSPVEAIRYQGSDTKSKGIRKGNTQMSINRLMTANLGMNRGRTFGTIITMGLSCVLFVVISNYTGNISTTYDARKSVPFGQFQIELDYSYNDTAYPENNLDSILKNNPLDEELLAKITKLDGVTEVKTKNMLYTFDENGNLDSIGVMDREQFEAEVAQGSLKGEVDYDKASEENAILYGWSYFVEESGYTFGDTVKLTVSGSNREIAFEGKMTGSFGSTNSGWVITEETYEALGFDEKNIGTIWVDCKEKDCAKVRAELETLLEEKEHYSFSSYAGALETSESSLGMLTSMVYAVLFLVGLIAFMNMANTIIINIITRKRELGVMQALGMTNKQMNRMLRNEGMVFTVGSIIISLAVGMPIGYALFCYGREHGFFGLNVYHIPVREIGVMIGILVLMQLVLSFVLSRNVKRESLVERIRYQE